MAGEERPQERPSFRVTDRRHWAQDAPVDTDETPTERKPSYVEELEARARAAEESLQTTLAQHRAAVDDFERARGRIERDAERRGKADRLEFLRSFLEVLDDVDRAVAAAAGADGPASLRDGYELIQRRFRAKLAEHGVERIEAAGQRFDPQLHEAVSMRVAASPDEDGVVVDVVAPGYRAGDDVLRPAQVVVAKRPASEGDAPPAAASDP